MEQHDGPSMLDSMLPEDSPEWVKQLAVLSLRFLLPGVKLRPGCNIDLAFLGATTARAVVAVLLATGQAAPPPKVIAELEAFIAAKGLQTEALAKADELVQREIEAQQAVIAEIMPQVVLLTEAEQRQFLKAYQGALKRGVEMLDPERVPVEDKIVLTMLFQWRRFAGLKSVSEVHKVLAAIFIQRGVVISRDRIAKLCRKIGLRYRGRGRPRKSDK